jgi:hypothetical protein
LLAWKGVEATLSLAKSDNTKVVVIGRGKDGLPIILDLRQDPTQSTIPDAGKGIGLVTDKQSTKQIKSSAQVTDQSVKQGENHQLATGQIANQIENVLTAAETKATTPLASMERYIKNFTSDEK